MIDRIAEARRLEYAQRREVTRLRLRLYDIEDPSSDAQRMEALIQAEVELHRLATLRMNLESASGEGTLIDTAAAEKSTQGIMLGAGTTGIEAKVELRMTHVPTGIVHLLDKDRTPLVTFQAKYLEREYARLRFTSFVEGYTATAMTTLELQPEDQVTVNHLPTFFPDALRQVTEMTRATLHIVIDDLDAKTEQETTYPIWLMARTAAYNGVKDPSTGQFVDLSPYYGAWVTPNAPEVMALLRRAAALHPQQHIVGYQVDAVGVAAQVKAVFEALKEQGIVYVNSLVSFGAGEDEYMQRVRLPRESLETKSANCIDGTVLMASVLEAASLNPAIVLIPGHAFLAWQSARNEDTWDYVETTMIGTSTFEAAQASARATAAKYEAKKNQTGDTYYFNRLPVPDLRAVYEIIPME